MEFSKRMWIAIVALGACARLLPHPWNFTPLIAIGLFAGAQARFAATGVVATLAALALSDAVLGFYRGFWYVYGAMLIPILLGRLIRNKNGVMAIIGAAIGSSISFFLITNFMVWATSTLYPHTLAGLATCFVAAIPFFQNQLLGDAFYTFALFGGYTALSRLIRRSAQAA